MAAFSRGSLLCAGRTNITPMKSSFLLSPLPIFQSISAQCAFSCSAIQSKHGAPVLPSKKPTRSNKIINVKEQLEKMKQRQQRLEEVKSDVRVSEAAARLALTRKQPAPGQAHSRQHLPLRQYVEREQSRSEKNAFPRREERKIETEAARILDHGEPAVLYIGPTKRWRLGVASALTGAVALFVVFGILWAYWPILMEARYNIVLNIAIVGIATICAVVFWAALRRRALMVRDIRLVPRQIGGTKIFEVEVKGTGWLPFQNQTVTAPIWEVSVDRPMAQTVLPPKPGEFRPQHTYNAFRPFVWAWLTAKGVWRELRYVILHNPFYLKKSVLLKLYTEEGGKFNYWLVDARAHTLLGGQEGFDYFIKSRKSMEEDD